MKKTYINPTISVFQMQMQQHVLAGSVGKDGNGDVQSVGFSGDYDGTSPIKSRQGSIWDDDEE